MCRHIYSNSPMNKLSSREEEKHVYSHEHSDKVPSQVSKKILGKILGKQFKNLFKVQWQNKAVSYKVALFP